MVGFGQFHHLGHGTKALGTAHIQIGQNMGKGLEMDMGRFFSEDFPSDSSPVVINKKGMEEMG